MGDGEEWGAEHKHSISHSKCEHPAQTCLGMCYSVCGKQTLHCSQDSSPTARGTFASFLGLNQMETSRWVCSVEQPRHQTYCLPSFYENCHLLEHFQRKGGMKRVRMLQIINSSTITKNIITYLLITWLKKYLVVYFKKFWQSCKATGKPIYCNSKIY